MGKWEKVEEEGKELVRRVGCVDGGVSGVRCSVYSVYSVYIQYYKRKRSA